MGHFQFAILGLRGKLTGLAGQVMEGGQAEQDFTDNREWRKRMFEHIQFGGQQEQLLHDLIFELEEEDGPTFPKERRQRMRPTQQEDGRSFGHSSSSRDRTTRVSRPRA